MSQEGQIRTPKVQTKVEKQYECAKRQLGDGEAVSRFLSPTLITFLGSPNEQPMRQLSILFEWNYDCLIDYSGLQIPEKRHA